MELHRAMKKLITEHALILLTAWVHVNGLEHQKIICEGNKDDIACSGSRINIVRAVYGRADSTTCPHGTVTKWSSTCTVDVTINIRYKCQSKKVCNIHASNSDGDPCSAILKYLNITYECIGIEEPTTDIPSTSTQHVTDLMTTESGDKFKTCSCPCNKVGSNKWEFLSESNLTFSEIKTLLQPHLDVLVDEISVDKSSTNKMSRTKVSARDNRQSSASMGYLGTLILSLVLIFLASTDLITLLKKCSDGRINSKHVKT